MLSVRRPFPALRIVLPVHQSCRRRTLAHSFGLLKKRRPEDPDLQPPLFQFESESEAMNELEEDVPIVDEVTVQESIEVADHGSALDMEDLKRKRKTEWKRRQKGETFVDQLIVQVRAGRGGDGCVAFHREKFKPRGPPSGGNGGRGGDVYLMPSPHLTTLSSVRRSVRGNAGGHGGGTWLNGKDGAPLIIHVPIGTVVKELTDNDPRRQPNEWERLEASLEGLDPVERKERILARRWLHTQGYEEDNVARDGFKEMDRAIAAEERNIKLRRLRRPPIHMDLDQVMKKERDVDAPLGVKDKNMGYLVASGGSGGLGNPHFLTKTNRSPKTATRALDGETLTLLLELKILADVALVGMPNAGKSTLLRALTGGRVKTEIASYAFTTLNPVVGVVRVAEDGAFEGENMGESVFEETIAEESEMSIGAKGGRKFSSEAFAMASAQERDAMLAAEEEEVVEKLDAKEAGPKPGVGYDFDLAEFFRFTVADNPGLIEDAADNKGLGHSFLRSIERSHALVYVVDFSGPTPWEDLRILTEEITKYKPGMINKSRMVIANKADLAEGNQEDLAKLRKLEEYVIKEMRIEGREGYMDVVPVSAKYSQNLRTAVQLMQGYVRDARRALQV